LKLNNKTVFIFKSRQKKESYSPDDFYYGYNYFKNADLIQQLDLGIKNNENIFWKIINKIFYPIISINLRVLILLANKKIINRLNSYDNIIVTTNILAMCFGLLKRLKLLNPNIYIIAMGIINHKASSFKIKLIKYILDKVNIICISKGEYNFLKKFFDQKKMHYLQFGVDKNFWFPLENNINNSYVLSVGNDSHRDYKLLIDAWKNEYPQLIILTQLKVTTFKKNIKIIKSDLHKKIFTDRKIREFYQNSSFVIVPLKATYQPSGQSVCLQAMGCGKAVILTELLGLWDRETMSNNKNCLLIQPTSVEDLQTKVEYLINSETKRREIGLAASETIKCKLNTINMASNLFKILQG